MRFSIFATATLLGAAVAAPVPGVDLGKRQSPTVQTAVMVDSTGNVVAYDNAGATAAQAANAPTDKRDLPTVEKSKVPEDELVEEPVVERRQAPTAQTASMTDASGNVVTFSTAGATTAQAANAPAPDRREAEPECDEELVKRQAPTAQTASMTDASGNVVTFSTAGATTAQAANAPAPDKREAEAESEEEVVKRQAPTAQTASMTDASGNVVTFSTAGATDAQAANAPAAE